MSTAFSRKQVFPRSTQETYQLVDGWNLSSKISSAQFHFLLDIIVTIINYIFTSFRIVVFIWKRFLVHLCSYVFLIMFFKLQFFSPIKNKLVIYLTRVNTERLLSSTHLFRVSRTRNTTVRRRSRFQKPIGTPTKTAVLLSWTNGVRIMSCHYKCFIHKKIILLPGLNTNVRFQDGDLFPGIALGRG